MKTVETKLDVAQLTQQPAHEVILVPSLTHLFDCIQKLPIAEDNHQKRSNKAEEKQTDDVRYVVRCLGCPVNGAGGSWTF